MFSPSKLKYWPKVSFSKFLFVQNTRSFTDCGVKQGDHQSSKEDKLATIGFALFKVVSV